MRDWVAEQALQHEQSRATAELTLDNVEALAAFSEHSFEVPSDYMSLTDPESSAELEVGEEERKSAEKEGREVTLRSFNLREQALRRALSLMPGPFYGVKGFSTGPSGNRAGESRPLTG